MYIAKIHLNSCHNSIKLDIHVYCFLYSHSGRAENSDPGMQSSEGIDAPGLNACSDVIAVLVRVSSTRKAQSASECVSCCQHGFRAREPGNAAIILAVVAYA